MDDLPLKEHSAHRDQLLFRRIANGDGEAFTEFFEAYSVKLAMYVAKFLDSDLWAKEIVQDVFMKLWSMKESIGEIEYPAAFVYRMIANRAKDHIKRREHEVKLHYHLSKYMTGSSNTTQEQFDYRFGEQVFLEAVQLLPAQRALIFRMRHEQGLGYDAIAQQLGLSRHTVRNQLNLALQKIRSHLMEHGDIYGILLLYSLNIF